MESQLNPLRLNLENDNMSTFTNNILALAVTISFLTSGCMQTSDPSIEEVSNSYLDVPFTQEYHEGFIVDNGVEAANDVRAVDVDQDGNVWIATKHGVYRKGASEDAWSLVIEGANRGPSYDVDADEQGNVWIATWDGVYSYLSGELRKMYGPMAPISRLVIADEGVYALGPKGIWLYNSGHWTRKEYTKARSMRAAISDGNGGLWIGTDVGLYHSNDNKTVIYQGNNDLISAYVRGIDYDGQGNIWVGGLGGVTIRNNTEKIGEKLPENGIINSEVIQY